MKKFLSLMVAVVFALTCYGTVMAAEPKAAPAEPTKAAPSVEKKDGDAAKPEKKKAKKKAAKKKAAKKAKKEGKGDEKPAEPTTPPPAAPKK